MMKSNLKLLKENKHILYVLKKAKPKLRNAILKHVDDIVIKTLNEILFNIMNKNHKINKSVFEKIKPYKNTIRKVCSPKTSVSVKRKHLIQKGGFLPVIISSLLSGVIGKILENVK